MKSSDVCKATTKLQQSYNTTGSKGARAFVTPPHTPPHSHISNTGSLNTKKHTHILTDWLYNPHPFDCPNNMPLISPMVWSPILS